MINFNSSLNNLSFKKRGISAHHFTLNALKSTNFSWLEINISTLRCGDISMPFLHRPCAQHGTLPPGLQLCPSSLCQRHSSSQGPHITDGILCAHLCQATPVGCGGHSIKPRERTGIQVMSHFSSGAPVPDAAPGPNPDPCPDRLVGAKGIKKYFPVIPGVLSFLDTPKCSSRGSQPCEEFDAWFVRSESLAAPGCTHFLITHLGGSVHSFSENTLHTDINPWFSWYPWKQEDRWPVLPRVTKHRMQMIRNN